MRPEIESWLRHPVTLSLVGAFLVVSLAVLEILLRRLAEMGNVRFQGLLDDHRDLLPIAGDAPFALSRIVDAVRWLEVVVIWLLWLVAAWFPGGSPVRALGVGLAAWLVVVAVSGMAVPRVREESVATLLRLVRPAVIPLLSTFARHRRGAATPPSEEEEEASEREIQAFLDVGEAAGIFEGEEGEFVESLVDFFDTTVREIMTPRTEIVAVPEDIGFAELVKVFAESHKSRIPVYRDTVDHIVGLVHVKGIVEHLVGGDEPAVTELLLECPVVPESKNIGELLREFQSRQQQMAVVADEYGGTAGIVTLEDILEEIVGEIQDEHEPRQPPEWQEIEPGRYRLLGRAPLEVLGELFGVEVDEDEVDTVGGLVFSRHGTVPEKGIVVVDEGLGLEFTVEEVDERRIRTVVVRRLQGGEPGDGG